MTIEPAHIADYVAAEDTCVGCGNGPLSILDKHHGRRCNCCRNGHSRMYVTYDTKFRPRGCYCSECLAPLQHSDGPAPWLPTETVTDSETFEELLNDG